MRVRSTGKRWMLSPDKLSAVTLPLPSSQTLPKCRSCKVFTSAGSSGGSGFSTFRESAPMAQIQRRPKPCTAYFTSMLP